MPENWTGMHWMRIAPRAGQYEFATLCVVSIGSFIEALGEAWERGDLEPYHEHFAVNACEISSPRRGGN